MWSTTEKRLFFAGPGSGEMYQVSYRIEQGSFVGGRPERWEAGDFSQLPFALSYGPHPDGQRFLLRKRVSGESQLGLDHVVLFENFFDYLEQQVPVP